jgi:RimJ/RimL family protein N-acetyltransferase
MFIRSERLFLRPAWPEDWAELWPAINDAGVVRNLAKAPWPYAMEDAMEFARLPQERLVPHFLITLPTSAGSQLIGSAGLGWEEGHVELGYWIARSNWGQGYATEAARAVLQLARALGHQRIAAAHFADNPASGRVLAKAGFVRIGEPKPRFSRGRGAEALGVPYGIELGADCAGADEGLMRAA